MVVRRKQAHRDPKLGPSAAGPFVAGAVVGGVLIWAALVVVGEWRRSESRARSPARSSDHAWTELPPPSFPVPPFARFLDGVRIVLDPGHVGQRDPGGDWKRGPTGLREAEVNLSVAHFLQEFLLEVGAEVEMTRAVDEAVDRPDSADLRERAEIANRARADLLLSIHHNASDAAETNYTCLFYHSEADHTAASLCAARHLLTGLNDALRLERHLECAVLSDRLCYENGLAVLREARVPAVLSEASFHSHPAEEERLRDSTYNRREAYGLFLGLARWAQAGLPRVALVRPANRRLRRGDEIVVALDDGLGGRGGWGAERVRILPDSFRVKLNDEPARYEVELSRRRLRITPPRGLRGPACVLRVDFENTLGQHVLHPLIDLELVGR